MKKRSGGARTGTSGAKRSRSSATPTRGFRGRLRVTVDDRAGRRPGRLKFPVRELARIARATLLSHGFTRGELSIVVTRDPQIRELNARYRGKDQATNVLSFPQDDLDAREAALPGAPPPQIGDVVISVDTVERQGTETGAGFRYTFAFYLVHGILHLLGHDHERPAEAKRMYRKTEEILSQAGEAPL